MTEATFTRLHRRRSRILANLRREFQDAKKLSTTHPLITERARQLGRAQGLKRAIKVAIELEKMRKED